MSEQGKNKDLTPDEVAKKERRRKLLERLNSYDQGTNKASAEERGSQSVSVSWSVRKLWRRGDVVWEAREAL